MLTKREDLENIKVGRISLAFRRWCRPTVRAGANFGELAIDIVTEAELTQIDARHASFSSRGQLIAELRKHPAGTLYRIRLRFVGPDSRVALRRRVKVPRDELDQIEKALHGLGLE
jgi:hypothetical protein